MATSPLFGWEEPDDVDLVKDGAAAIRTLGNAIDTSMGDLLGGTTGQILSKNSNTNMDFTWVAPTSGDITGVTAGTGITGGGTSGDVTVSFDQANYGGGQFSAGKNKIINGDFGIWQRGTSFALSSTSAYTADRFIGDAGSMAYTFSRQTFTPASAPVSGYEGTYFYRALAVSGSGGYPKIMQKIEDVRAFAGQAVTLSFWAKASSAITVSPDLIQEFGSGGSSTVYTGVVSTSITTSWVRYSINYTVPSISGKTIGTGSSLTVSFNLPSSGTASFDIWGVQLEAGSTATPFQTASGTIAGELQLAQRYYYRTSANNSTTFTTVGNAYSTTNAVIETRLPVTMRVTPTAVDFTTLQIYSLTSGGQTAATGVTLNAGNGDIMEVIATVSSGLTSGHIVNLRGNGSGAYLGFSAEL